MSNSSARSRSGTPVKSGLVVGLVLLGAVACNQRHDMTATIMPDYRDRHPIHLVRGNDKLDVFVGRVGGMLDRRQQEDVRHFAREYMNHGEGPLIAYLPSGGHSAGVSAGLNGIRSALAGGGASGRLQIAHYQADPSTAATIKLVFARLQARVDSKCSYENDEVVASTYAVNAQNVSPHNFGCSYQRNLAAQIADPRDLVRPRIEGPVDVTKRLAGIEKIREGGANEISPGGTSLKQGIQQ